MKFEDIIRSISEEFIQAWNKWDIERMMKCLTADVRLQSPNVSLIYPENDTNILVGKELVQSYWSQLSQRKEAFEVVQISLVKVDLRVTTMNRVVGTDIVIRKSFTMNEYGKINDLVYEYRNSPFL